MTVSQLLHSRTGRFGRGGDSLTWVVLAVSTGTACGLAAPRYPVAAVVGLMCSVLWLNGARWYPGIALGAWALVATNTVPFLNLDAYSIPGTFSPGDLLLFLLMAAALLSWTRGARPAPLGRLLTAGLAAFAALWVMTALRSWLIDGIPLLKAVLFGRDFLFYGATLVAARYLLCRNRRESQRALTTMTLGAVIYALAQVFYQITGIKAGWIVHPYLDVTEGYLARPYQESVTLVWLLVPLCLALGLGAVGRSRRAWLLAAVVLGLAALLNQTRASYLGMIVAVLFVIGLTLMHGNGHYGIRRLYALLAVILVAGAVIVPLASSPSRHAVDQVVQRATSMVGAFGGSQDAGSATLTYRVALANRMLGLIGSDWPLGMGFLHPSVRYFAALPQGSIRSTDLGLMQLLMTTGAIGVTLLLGIVLVPMLAALRWLRVSALGLERRGELRAIVTGALAATVGALAASMTLGTFVDRWSAMVAGVITAMMIVAISNPDESAAAHSPRAR